VPEVSVVIPSYNSAKYLPETLNSVLKQTFTDFEIIVVDDGSTDNTKDVVASFKSDKVRYIFQENSGGPSLPRNVGIKAAKGKYIAFFDSDDIMVPNKLEKSVYFLSLVPNLGFIFSNFIKFDDKSGVNFKNAFLAEYHMFLGIKKKESGSKCYVIDRCDAYNTLFYENYIGTSSVVVPKKVLLDVGYFDESLRNSDDRDMWFRISKNYDIGFIDMIGHNYRVHEGSISFGDALSENKIKAMRKQLENDDIVHSTRRQGHKIISENLLGIGYKYQMQGDMTAARKNYILCLKEYFGWQAIKGILFTFLPHKLHSLMKRYRG